MTNQDNQPSILTAQMQAEIAQAQSEDYASQIMARLKPRFSPRPLILAVLTLVGAFWTASQMRGILHGLATTIPTNSGDLQQYSFNGMTITMPFGFSLAAFVVMILVCILITARE
ncbi:MAG: hypothetical protein V3V30_03495 [Parvularculaceae bacterium]